MSTPDPSLSQFPMRVVVRRTGLNASLLRAWERRYGAVEPGRSDGGQRLYSEDDIRKLLLLKELVDQGHNIGQVADRDPGELRMLLRQTGGAAVAGIGGQASAPNSVGPSRNGEGLGRETSAILEACVEAAHHMDTRGLENQLNRAAMALNPTLLVDGVLVPLLNRIGLLWSEGELGPASEHVASGVIRRFLDWLLDTLDPDPRAPVAAVGTPAGHRHEFGALLASVVLTEEGWQVLNLGPDLPADEIADAATRKGARLVALSALYPREDPGLPAELRRLRRGLAEAVPILVGGPAAAPFADLLLSDGVTFLPDLQMLREESRAHLDDLETEGVQ